MTTEPCGCTPTGVDEPARHNRPGRDVLDYRLGRHGDFLSEMMARLHAMVVHAADGTTSQPLARLTTRASDDPSIALLDASAVVADILAFTTERIANEGYLRTATERRSVLELARSIGYELHPGRSASTHVAFVLDDGAGSSVTIPAGTGVDSLPTGTDPPQTFETAVDLPSRPRTNAIPLRTTLAPTLALVDGTPHVYRAGEDLVGPDVRKVPAADVAVVDGPDPSGTWVSVAPLEVLALAGTSHGLVRGDRLAFAGDVDTNLAGAVVRIGDVDVDDDAGITRIALVTDPRPPDVDVAVPPAPATVTPATVAPLDRVTAAAWIRDRRWRDGDLRGFLEVSAWDPDLVVTHVDAPAAAAPAPPRRGVYAFDVRTGAFGHNAPLWDSLPKLTDSGDLTVGFRKGDPFKTPWDPTWNVFHRYPADTPWPHAGDGHGLRLARTVDGVAAGSWILVEQQGTADVQVRLHQVTDAWDESVTAFSLAGEVTALALAESRTPDFVPTVRGASLHVASRRLPLAPLPLSEVLADPGGRGADVLVLDGLHLSLQAGQAVTVTGLDADLDEVTRAEVVVVDRVEHHHGDTVLFLATALDHRLVRATTVVNANTVAADHGVSGVEVLGSGRADQAGQSFALPRTGTDHLTHVAAASPSGVAPALEVRVDGVRWDRVGALFGHGPDDPVWVLRLDDDGTARVVFGDGVTGSRLPTGTDNVTATYRVGVGAIGEVPADALTLLAARPPGVRSVTNPEPAAGAQDPEVLADARRNAPLTVRTLDRVVSVADHADFARSFAGIGKARADRLHDRRGELLVVTVASATGAPLADDADVIGDLASAIEQYRDPVRPVQVIALAARTFDLAGTVVVDPRHEPGQVLEAVVASLRDAFAPEVRDLAQDVTKSEVVTAVHAVAGVVAVDIDLLATTGAGGVAGVVRSEPATWGPDGVLPAQLLTINPGGIDLGAVTP